MLEFYRSHNGASRRVLGRRSMESCLSSGTDSVFGDTDASWMRSAARERDTVLRTFWRALG